MQWSTRTISVLSMLTSITVLLEVVGGLLPGVGALICGFSTLFVALAGYLFPVGGLLVYAASSLLIGILMPAKVFVFIFNTGLLGLALGITFRIGRRVSVLITSLVLTIGTLFLSFILGIPVLGIVVHNIRGTMVVLVVFLFSLLFCWLWYIMMQRVLNNIGYLFNRY